MWNEDKSYIFGFTMSEKISCTLQSIKYCMHGTGYIHSVSSGDSSEFLQSRAAGDQITRPRGLV